MKLKPLKYNPSFLSEDELIERFVVREAEFKHISGIIGENTNSSNSHVMLIAPRGFGKTMLVRRIAIEVKNKPNLSKNWYPIIYGEESYFVTSAAEFWLETIFHIGEQSGEEKWEQIYKDYRRETDLKKLHDRALGRVIDFSKKVGKKLLIIVENLNMLFNESLTEDDGWALRHTLQNNPNMMLLATATNRFDQIDHIDKAFFEQFRIFPLDPLTESECNSVWESITGKAPKDRRMRAVQILTGGNPRLVAIVSEFGANLSIKELLTNLIYLVDEHTEYFKSHLDALAPIERKVYLSLADLWRPATTKEIADSARLNTNKTSSLLKRLIERGAVSEFGDGKHKKSYQVSERMYNIYHLMRRRGDASGRIKAVVNVMIDLYGEEGLHEIVKCLTRECSESPATERGDLYHAFTELYSRYSGTQHREKILRTTPREFFTSPDAPEAISKLYSESLRSELVEIDKLIMDNEHELAEFRLLKLLDSSNDSELCFDIGIKFLLKFLAFDHSEQAWKKSIEIKPDFHKAWYILGLLHATVSRFNEAEQAYRKSIEIKQDYCDAWYNLGNLYDDQKRFDEAEQAYLKAIEIKPDYHEAWYKLIVLKLRIGKVSEIPDLLISCFASTNWDFIKNPKFHDLMILLCTSDYASDLLEIFREAPNPEALEPLQTGIRLYLGEDPKTIRVAPEILEIGKDIREKIEQTKTKMEKVQEPPESEGNNSNPVSNKDITTE